VQPFCLENGYTCPPKFGVIFSRARGDLKLTKSYSSNILIKLFHLNKPNVTFPEYLEQLQLLELPNAIIEQSGYLTVVDHTLEEVKKKPIEEKKEETKFELSQD
jgi:hypothetical protein